MSNPPVLLRVAGLPAAAVERFSSPELLHAAARGRALEERLERMHGELVDALYDEVGDQDPELRSFLLSLKRACYNHRPLEGRAADVRWSRLPLALRESLQAVLRGERELAAENDALRLAWERRLLDERAALREHLGNASLLRGVSMASQPLARRLPALGPPTGPRDRKLRKLEQSLLRYLSRAAAKLSPYSTLTRAGLGMVAPRTGDERIELLGGAWRETSLLRTRRYVVDQIGMVLTYSRTLRGEASVRLNDTLERLPSGDYQLLRPELLRQDESAGQLRYVRMSLTRLALRGELVESILGVLEGLPDGLTVAEITRRCLEREPPDEADESALRERIEALVDGLLSAGVLLPTSLWTTDEVHLERAMAEGLGRSGSEAVPVSLRRDLVDLVERQSEFAAGGRPTVAALEEMDGLIHSVWDQSCRLAETELRLHFPDGDKYNFYEDVFLHDVGAGGEIARLDAELADELLSVGDVLWSLVDFFHPRRQFLLAVDHLIERRWGETACVPFLRVFQEAQALWKDFVAFSYDRRDRFDPFGSPAVAALDEQREALRRELLAIGESEILDLPRLFAVERRIPAEHRSPVGSCLFVQPLDREGSRWVLNRLFEGCGRYTSRFSSAMPEPLRRRYLAHYLRGSRREAATGGPEIVDVLYGHENTVNLHYPQTGRVLVIPGESTRLPRRRRLYLGDLWIQRAPGEGVPRIVDGRGRWCLPCHLSALNTMYLPVLVKFLSAFGPSSGGGKAIFPWRTEDRDGVTVSAPIEVGRLLIRRRRWIFPTSALPPDDGDAVARFVAFERWRLRHGIPRRVFHIERIHENATGQPVYKPQYVDFSSPLLLEVFFAGVKTGGAEKVTLEEALPTPDAYPAAAAGDRWAVEFILERLVVPRPSTGRREDLDVQALEPFDTVSSFQGGGR